MDGYTYENTVGGWQVCDVCSARVTNPIKHTAWHQALDKRTTWQPFGGPL